MVGAISSSLSQIVTPSGTPERAIDLLFASKGFLDGQLAQTPKRAPLNETKILTTLWGLVNPKKSQFVGRQDLENAILEAGGTKGLAATLWAQLDPGNKGAITQTDFVAPGYIKNAIKNNLPKLQVAVDKYRVQVEEAALEKENAGKPTLADKALARVFEDKAFLQGQADQSAKLVPTTKGKILATLWGLINPNKAKIVNRKTVDRAILQQGGTTAEADALWKKLDPKKAGGITVGDFATNDYMNTHLTAQLPKIQDAVEKQRFQSETSPVGSNNILDSFFRKDGSGTILDFFI